MAGILFVCLFLLSVNQLLSTTFAQTAQCFLGTFQWAINSRKQDPCAVATSLFNVCSSDYQLNSLIPGQHYDGPSIDGQNPCQCSTVSYSLISACAACQNATITQWSEWSANCESVSISTFAEPIPSGVFVPGWAYLDVKSGDMFNVTLAKLNANKTESVAIPPPTSSLLPPPVASQTASSGISSHQVNDSISNSEANAIVGGIVGATMGFAAIFLFLVHRHMKRVEKSAANISLESPIEGSSPSTSVMEKNELPALVVHPPKLPFYQNQAGVSAGTLSNSTMTTTGSDRIRP